MSEAEFHSGFVCLVGRPNTGKSTLINALVGTKVAITSNRPQTTRHAIRGIVNRPDAQLILIDTPGLHRPRTLLGQRLNDVVRDTYSEVDVICVCIPADEAIGPGDRRIVEQDLRHLVLLGEQCRIRGIGRDFGADEHHPGILGREEALGNFAIEPDVGSNGQGEHDQQQGGMIERPAQ